jgi:Sulfatase
MAQQEQKKPNILVIWGDDIGQSNLSCYTHGLMGYRTPNIDRIAKEGMLFTDSYGEQSCTAGRSSFITGQSVYRTGLSKVGIPAAPIGGNVDIDVNRNVNINNTHINRASYQQNLQARGVSSTGQWQHDPTHRKGVSYRDNGTAQKFNRGTNAQAAQARETFRGRAESGRQELARGGAEQGGIGAGEDSRASKVGSGDRGGAAGRDAEAGSKLAAQGGSADRAGGLGGGNRAREADAFQGTR